MAGEHMREMFKDNLVNRRMATAAVLLSALAISGCGDRVSGSKQAIEPCGHKVYNFLFGKQPLASTAQVLATAEADVIKLQKRALANKGSIDLSDYDAVEVAASPKELTIGFSAASGDPYSDKTGDYVSFEANGATATVSPGAVVCSANGNLYPNGTYHALEKYTRETATFPEQ